MTKSNSPATTNSGAPDTAVVLVNLGTPDAPTPSALRRYLAEFLSDRRVVELPPWLWWFILHGIILRIRPARSAEKYASIWTEHGSPLAYWTRQQAQLLDLALSHTGHRVVVRYAMRYGQPAIADTLDALQASGVKRILVLPLYPQYAASSSGTVYDAVSRWSLSRRALPELRLVNQFHDHNGYLSAVAKRIQAHWAREGLPDRLLISFHGVPQRCIDLGDPYQRQCQRTAELLAAQLGLRAEQWTIAFQSRFGKAKWIEPATDTTLLELARAGVRRVDVVCPGFVADCLETLEEINGEARETFLGAGGQVFHYIACLNDDREWLAALADLTTQNLQGWPTLTTPP